MKIANQFIILTILASALASHAASVPAPDDQEEPSVAANGNGYFVVWADKRTYASTEYDIYGARVSSTGEVLDPGGIPICTDPGRQTSPRVAFDGRQYLVVWEDDRESTSATQLYQIYGARVGLSGQVLDANGFKITTNRVTRLGPAVVSNGQGFFVAWEDWQRTDNAIADIYGSPVSSDGAVAKPDGIPLVLGAGWQVQPRLAFANGEYLMTYRESWTTGPDIWGIRVSTVGQPLSSAFRISNSNDEAGGRYGLASNGRDYFVVWGDNRGSPSGFGYPKIYGTLVRGNGVVVSPDGIPIATNSLYQERPRIAWDGNDFMVVWQESNDAHSEFTDIYGAKITGDGTVGVPARIAVNRAPGVQYNPDVAFTAGNYLVIWQDGRGSPNNTYPLGAYDIFGTLVTGTGAVSPTNGFLISGWQPNAPPMVTIVNPGDGNTFTAPVNILLEASVHDEDGLAAQATVDFFDRAGRVGVGQLTDPGPPHDAAFRFFWTNVPVGEYTLTAEATDDRGAQTTSPPVRIAVRSGRPVVNVEVSKADAYELGDGKSRALIFRVTRTDPIDFDLPVSYRVGGTAQNGVDYEALSGRVIIPFGAREATILTSARFDEISEGDETVEVVIGRPACNDIVPPPRECYEVGEHAAARGFIHDALVTPPVVWVETIEPATSEPYEAGVVVPGKFSISRTGPTNGHLLVFLQYGGTASNAVDYRELPRWFVEIPAGRQSAVLDIVALADTLVEGKETVEVKLLPEPPDDFPLDIPIQEYRVDTNRQSGRVIIFDRQTPLVLPTVSIEATAPEARECAPNQNCPLGRFTLRRLGELDYPLSVFLYLEGSATPGVDYQTIPPVGPPKGGIFWIWVEFPSGASTVEVPVSPIDDLLTEGDETVRARLAAIAVDTSQVFPPRDYQVDTNHAFASVVIHDKVPLDRPVVSLELVDPNAMETLIFQNNIDWAEFRVLRTGPATEELPVYLDTQQGTARLGEDYWLDGVNNGSTVRFLPGQSSVNVRLYPIDDAFFEGDETVFVHLIAPPFGPSSSGQYEIDFAHSSVALVIHDNDPVANRLEITSPSDGEQFQPGDTIELRAQIIGLGSDGPWSVDFFAGDQKLGTTRPGAPIWWGDAPGGHHVITARAVDSQGAVLTSVPVTIQVGPGAALPVVGISAVSWRTGEPCPTCLVTPGLLTIERTAPTNTPLTVFLAIDGTATPGDDYQALPASVEIPAGQRSAQLTLLARDDRLAEGPEIVRVRVLPQPPPLLPPTYFVNVHAKEAQVVIFDDEPDAPQARLDIVAPTNGSHLEFPSTVELSALAVYTQNEVYGPVEFYAGDQFIARSLVTASTRPPIPGLPSAHTAYWANPPVGQHVLTARTRLSSSQSITSPPVNVIVDSPMVPVVRLETLPLQNAQAPEFCPLNADCAYPSFVVRRSGPTNADLRVYLSYSGTAAVGTDYPPLPDSLVIPAGRDAASLMLVPKDDTLIEGPETVVARFTAVPGPGYIQDPDHSSATITIIDNERPLDTVVSIGVDDPISSEISMLTVIDPARFRITRTGDLSRDLLVFYSLHGSATPGLDYQELPLSIRIPSGQSSVTFDVTPKFDQLEEGMETVYVRLEPSPLAGPLPNYEIAPAGRAALAIILDNGSFPTAGLEIVRPAQGDQFTPPASIEIVAAAYHPTRDIARVDFYAGAVKIGESQVADLDPITGGLIVHRFTWNDPLNGVHLLTAHGFDQNQLPILTSAPVSITVGTEPPRPVLTVAATSRIAEESSVPFRRMNLVGEFTISRTRPTNDSLSVFVQYSGMATRGVDYPSLPRLVTIPPGSVSTAIRIEATNDQLPEGIETLVATLSHCGPGIDPATGNVCIDGYEIDPAHQSATVFIRDDGITTATLAITRPQDGAAFNSGDAIVIEAVAIDLNGYISRVEFWDGEQKLGASEIVFIRPPDPGTPIEHRFEWRGAASGAHILTARITRADGTALQSQPVHVMVGSVSPIDRELHAISIYSGVTANGGPSRNNERGEAAVVVNRPGKKVTLFLSSYEPVFWHVTVGNATIIQKVILGGYYRQEIDGIGAGVEIINAFYDEGLGTSNYLWPGTSLDSGRFFRVLQKLCDLVGMDLASFQGTYTAPYPAPLVVDQVQSDPRLRCDYPQPVDLTNLPDISFRLAFNDGGSGSVAFQDYTLHGVANASRLLPAWRVVTDAGGRYYYGADFHRLWKVDSQTATVQEMQIPSNLPEFSWPVGIAFDSLRNRILVATLVGEGYLYAYSPASNQWSLVRGLENRDLDTLVYHAANDSLYGVTTAYYDGGAPSLIRLNANGEVTGEMPLPVQPYGVGVGGSRSELASVGEYLVLLLETGDWVVDNGRPEARLYLIDPRTGQLWLTYRKVGASPNRPPTVTIFTPSNGATFNAGTDIVLGANVTDPDGDLSRVRVEFFANGTKIGDAVGPNTSPVSWVFSWMKVPPGNYTLTARATDTSGASSVSAPVRILVSEPAIAIGYPREGDIFTGSTNILIAARIFVAVGTADFLGAVTNVEFFANHVKLGEVHSSLPDPEPMPPFISFAFTWTNPPPGAYALTAKATTDTGATQTSLPVHIAVGPVASLVWIEATSPIAEEDSAPFERLPLAGEFTISRTGPTNAPLSIFVQYSGMATPGVDYSYLPWMVTIPAGAVSTKIRVVPNNDQTSEGIETLVARISISICPPLTDPPMGIPCVPLEIDQATVFIRDDGITTASLAVTRPNPGGTFAAGETILIEAIAIDLNGYMSWVEFWDGDLKIGDSVIDFLRAPDPGIPITHSFAWRNAAPGPHVLTARAIRSDGTVLKSAPVRITVGSDTLPTVDVIVRDAFAVEPRTNADVDTALFGIRRVGPTNADLVVIYSLQGTAANGVDYEKLSGEIVIPAGQRLVTLVIRPLPDNLTERDESVILRLEDSPGGQPPRYYVGLQRRAVAIISDNASAPAPAGVQYLSLTTGLPHICFAAESGRTYGIEASNDLRHWENVGVAAASGGALHFVDPEATNIQCRFYRLAPEPIALTDE